MAPTYTVGSRDQNFPSVVMVAAATLVGPFSPLFRRVCLVEDRCLMKQQKNVLRQQALARRSSLPAKKRQAIAQGLVVHAEVLFPDAVSETVAAFWPVRSEIDPRPLMTVLEGRGATLALPAIDAGDIMVFRRYAADDRLVAMAFGTCGPATDAATVEPTTILLPLAAFDRQGNRIGYGGGFYDRTVAALHKRGLKPRLVGLGFDCQQVKAIPVEPHDIPLMAILTESGLQWFV